MTQVEAAKIVAVLLAAFPSAKTLPGTAPLYEQMLADLDYAAVNAAVQNIMSTTRYPTLPTIGEIRAAALDMTAGPRRAGGDAWGDVRDAIGRYGSYRVPGLDFNFADPIVARSVQALGWKEICLSENQVADRARFVDLYEQLATNARKEQQTSQLPAVRAYRELQAVAHEQVESLGRLLSSKSGRS